MTGIDTTHFSVAIAQVDCSSFSGIISSVITFPAFKSFVNNPGNYDSLSGAVVSTFTGEAPYRRLQSLWATMLMYADGRGLLLWRSNCGMASALQSSLYLVRLKLVPRTNDKLGRIRTVQVSLLYLLILS